MKGLGNGQVWWADLEKVRPVVVLTRSRVAPRLSRVVVALERVLRGDGRRARLLSAGAATYPAPMSSTRLLVLGVVRIFQPVHGYDVRRELLSWNVEQWANVAPGSVYSALKTLERDGLVEVAATDQRGGRPERTLYQVTPEGDKQFGMMLRESWWTVTTPLEPLMPALCFMPWMNRKELVAALRSRAVQLEALREANRYAAAHVGGDPAQGGTPEHVTEFHHLVEARMAAEVAWAQTLADRLEEGAYALVDETPEPEDRPPS